MDFDLTNEQQLLKASVERLLADCYRFEHRTAYMADGWSRARWAQYAELGLLGVPFEERYGGSGGGPVETMIVMEAFGHALTLEPYLTTVVVGGGLLRHGASVDQKAALLPRIADGTLLLAFAQTESQSRFDLHDVATTARRDGTGWRLDGSKTVVMHGDTADRFLVTARVAGGSRDREGIALFLVDAKARGVSRRGYPTVDGLRAAEIRFEGVRVGPEHLVGEPENALPLVERVVDEAIAAMSAEAVGAMAAMQELTVEYLKTRQQFGRAIGSFQALQHRAVDMLVALEQARSMALYATLRVADEDAGERRKALAATKVQIGRSSRFVGQQAVQLHGGIGMTMEYKLGHCFKRVTAIDLAFGNADHHLAALAAAGGLIAPE